MFTQFNTRALLTPMVGRTPSFDSRNTRPTFGSNPHSGSQGAGQNSEGDFFASIFGPDEEPSVAQQTRLAQLDGYLDNLKQDLQALVTMPANDYEFRTLFASKIKQTGLLLTQEGMREDDEDLRNVGQLYQDCSEMILDPLKSPKDIMGELEDRFIELRSPTSLF